MAKKSLTAKIREFMNANPGASSAQLIKALRVPDTKRATVYVVRSQIKKGTRVVEAPTPAPVVTNDPINHPMHYTTGGIETIDFIEAKDLNYRLGNAVKYIARAAHKGNYVEDLKKAVWYIERELERCSKL